MDREVDGKFTGLCDVFPDSCLACIVLRRFFFILASHTNILVYYFGTCLS